MCISDLPFRAGEYGVRQRAGGRREELPAEIRAEFAEFYRAQFEACSDRFGASVVRRNWRSFR